MQRILYGTRKSGHSHRVELFLGLLGLDFEYVETGAQAQRSPAFLAMNPFGQIPVLRDGDTVLPDSNAILVYLALRYDQGGQWYSTDSAAAARVQRWLSVAAGEVFNGPNAARLVKQFDVPLDHPRAVAIASQLLSQLERHLLEQGFLAGDTPTIADVACYSYVAHAPEGAVSLQPFPEVRAWLGRIEGLPRFVPMPASPLPP